MDTQRVFFAVDLDAFSEHLADLIRESLRESGIASDVDAKQIEIEVVHLDFMFKGPCLIDYNVTLGGEDRFGLQSTGESGNFAKACRSATVPCAAETKSPMLSPISRRMR